MVKDKKNNVIVSIDEVKIINLIMRMVESSDKRMEIIMKQPLEKKYIYDTNEIKLAQKEFEMQLKLLDIALKNLKGGKTPSKE